jgi:hypothetical protein
MEMWIHGDRLGMGHVFLVNGQATNVIHSCRRLYKRPCREERIQLFRMEAGSNASTVALRVVGGDKKGSLETERKIWTRAPGDSDPKMTAGARARSDCKRQTRPPVRESAPHQQTRKCLTVIKIWS